MIDGRFALFGTVNMDMRSFYLNLELSLAVYTPETVAATRDALKGGTPTLMFCKSGMRSTTAWALGEAAAGGNVDEIIARAGACGYDLSPLRAALRQTGAGG